MEKKKLIARMKEHTNNACFISKKELAEALGYESVNSVSKFVYGLPKVNKRYFIDDVADSIISFKEF